MKRTTMFLIGLALATAAFASPQSMQRILTQALQGERAAAARYDAFAAKAEADGYLGVASLFRACAKAERIHAARFVAAMNGRNLPIPDADVPKIEPGSTRSNLEDAIAAEQAERDGAYLYAMNAAANLKDDGAVKLFDVTRDTEVEHANLCAAALRNLNAMRAPHEYFVCSDCGYTTDVTLPLCPSCRSSKPPEPAN